MPRKTLRKREQQRGKFSLSTQHTQTRVPRTLFSAELEVAIPINARGGSTATTTITALTLKLNSLADANWVYSGLANFNSIYKRYRVLGFDIRVQFSSRHSTLGFICSGLPTNSATAAAAVANVLANGVNPGGKLAMLSTISGGSDLREMRFRSKIAAFEGTQEVETSSDFAAATSAVADPTQLLYLQLAAAEFNGTSTTFALNILATGSMWVRYFDAVQQ